MDKILVSVCMITYNHENFIKTALESVLMQKADFDIEFVISNDHSSDGTNKIIQRIIDNNVSSINIKYYNHSKNLGMMSNFIFALKECKGKYIALCEGDDYWTDPLKLQKQVDFLEDNKDYVLCFHRVNILERNGAINKDFITNVPKNHETIQDLVRYGNYIHTPSVVFKNTITEIPFEFLSAPFGDFFLYIMLISKGGKIKFIPEIMAIYRYGVGTISRMSDLEIANNNVLLYSCMISYLKDDAIKKIIFERQLEIVSKHYNQIHEKYENAFVSNHFLFKKIKIIKAALKRFTVN